MTDADGIDVSNPAFWQLVVVSVLIEFALLLSDHANDYVAVRTIYLRHAERTEGDASVVTSPHVSRRMRFKRWIRSGQ
ncbi:hypothetical protein KDN32_17390 [Nocardioides sp. J2M5]|uniref:hypothetical protein n=1 Tax=Nocardioides palaemonis TaxID=2829810 RepID=UPI001BA76096|nr:hypothetical protein [Nocardioides palaemonis]MBS2939519.1 hypothetical protein [Nocardioides palaemonis]